MLNKKFSESNEAIQLKNKIETWRNNKTSSRMPEPLWADAVSEAKKYSPSSVAKFLKIGHAELITRIPNYTLKNIKPSHGFIELSRLPEVQAISTMEVHLLNRDGHSASIRYSGSSADWENVFTGWFKASQSVQQGQTS